MTQREMPPAVEASLRPVPPTGGADIGHRSVASAGWLITQRVVANVIRLLAVAVLARHLTPSEFGVVALAQVLLQFITLAGEAGIGTYVIYDAAEGREERVSAAFWLHLALTAAQCALCLAVIPLLGRLFEPVAHLTAVLAVLVGVFFVRQMAVVPAALVQRELRHPLLAKRDIVFNVLSAVASVVLAVAGAGVWSLVIPAVLLEPARTVVVALTVRWRPRLPLRTRDWRRILRYTAPLMGSNLLVPVTNDGDTLLVGKLLGTATVGHYNLAWQLSNLVGRNITTVVNTVAMPALALLRDDLHRFRTAYLRMIRLLGYSCLPPLAGIAVVARDGIPAVYGPRWEPVIDLVRVFIAFTLVRTLTSPSSLVYNVTGRPDIGFKVTAWTAPAYLLAILIGSEWGAIGVAWGVVLVRTAGALVELRLALARIDLTVLAVGRMLAPPVALTTAMAAAVAVGRAGLYAAGVDVVPRLIACVILGAAVYLSLLLRLRPPGYDDLVRSLRRYRRVPALVAASAS